MKVNLGAALSETPCRAPCAVRLKKGIINDLEKRGVKQALKIMYNRRL
jgi:hypothetical protein